MVGYTKILLASVEAILVISSCLLLTTGLPLPIEDGDEQEITVDASTAVDCKLNQNKNSTYCAFVSVVILIMNLNTNCA